MDNELAYELERLAAISGPRDPFYEPALKAAAALRESEEWRRDAERFRWLRDTWGRFIDRVTYIEAGVNTPGWLGPWKSFDHAIDDAMRGGEGSE